MYSCLPAILKSRSLFPSTLPWLSLGYYCFLHDSMATASWQTHTTIQFPILSYWLCFPEVNLLPSPYFTSFITDNLSWQWWLSLSPQLIWFRKQMTCHPWHSAAWCKSQQLTCLLFIWKGAVLIWLKLVFTSSSELMLLCDNSLFSVKCDHYLPLKHLSSRVRCLQQQLHLTDTDTSCCRKQSHIQDTVSKTIGAARFVAL